MKIRAMIEDQDNIAPWLQWRITNPYEILRKRGIDADIMWANVGEHVDTDIDIMVLPRLVVAYQDREATEEWFNKIKSNGTKIVYEADDDIWSESYVEQLSKVYWKPETGPEGMIPVLDVLSGRADDALWTLNQCDAVTLSVAALGAYVKTITDIPVFVVNNAIDVNKFVSALWIESARPVSIGWAGGKRSENDLENVIDAWAMINDKWDNVEFVIGGWMPELLDKHKELKEKVVFKEWIVGGYARNMQVDIGCCSTADTLFSSRKSPIKAWEYALAGALPIGSETVYGKEPIIPIATSVEEWYKTIDYYLSHPNEREAIARIYKDHVLTYHSLEHEYVTWIDAYAQITKERVGV